MSIRDGIDKIIDMFDDNVPHPDNEYMGDDGLLHCKTCHEPTQCIIKHPFTHEERKVGVACACVRKKEEMYKEKQKREERDRQRRICFSETNMAGWTFEHDDRMNEKLSDAMMNYADQFADFRKTGKGLLLYGTVGTGKTYYAASIANRLIDNGYTVLMSNFASLTNKMQGMYDGKQEFINSLNRYSLLIIDDLGAERKTEFMAEQVFNIIDSRYRSGLPMIITTNLSIDEIKKTTAVEYSRIYDRILERCHPVKVDGGSRRRKKVKDTFFDVQEKLGL